MHRSSTGICPYAITGCVRRTLRLSPTVRRTHPTTPVVMCIEDHENVGPRRSRKNAKTAKSVSLRDFRPFRVFRGPNSLPQNLVS